MSELVKEVEAWEPPVEWVKDQILKSGNKLGSVHFKKRSNGQLRKMSYRLHVKNPSVASAPKGLTPQTKEVEVCSCGKLKENCDAGPYTKKTIPVPVDQTVQKKKDIDIKNNQITVFDANKVVREKTTNKIIGRGAWRTVPLENVIRIRNNGVTYNIKRYEKDDENVTS